MQDQKKNIIEDVLLIKQLKSGNQLAFSIIYDKYSSQAFSLSFKYLCNKQLAEDAVQNLFMKLWIKREWIDETKPINRYIFTVLKNDLLNVLRDSKKNVFVQEDCLAMLLNIEGESDSEESDQEQIDILAKAIERLSPQRKKIFEMKISGKYSNQDIAEILNLSVNTIKFQYSQSLKLIRSTVRELAIILLIGTSF